MTIELRYVPDENVMSTELPDGGSVLLHLSTELYFGLNAVGTRVWQLIGEQATCAEIIDAVAQEYPEADRSLINGDVRRLLGELEEKALVTAAPGS